MDKRYVPNTYIKNTFIYAYIRIGLHQKCSRASTEGGRRPLPSLYEMIHYLCFMYVCDLARVWRSPTSHGIHLLLF